MNDKIRVKFLTGDEKDYSVEVEPGTTVLEAARQCSKIHSAELNGEEILLGSCDGSLACSTCHVKLPKDMEGRFPSPSEGEDDMLDIAESVGPNSRLGCQLCLKGYESYEFNVPDSSRSSLHRDLNL